MGYTKHCKRPQGRSEDCKGQAHKELQGTTQKTTKECSVTKVDTDNKQTAETNIISV